MVEGGDYGETRVGEFQRSQDPRGGNVLNARAPRYASGFALPRSLTLAAWVRGDGRKGYPMIIALPTDTGISLGSRIGGFPAVPDMPSRLAASQPMGTTPEAHTPARPMG